MADVQEVIEAIRKWRADPCGSQTLAEIDRIAAKMRADKTDISIEPATKGRYLLFASCVSTAAEASTHLLAGGNFNRWMVLQHNNGSRFAVPPSHQKNRPGPDERIVALVDASESGEALAKAQGKQ